MLIGNKYRVNLVKAIILFTLLFSNYSCSSEKKIDAAWWLDITIKPAHIDIIETPVKKIDPSWKYATVLDEKIFSDKISKKQLNKLQESNFSFHSAMDINKDGAIEDIFVGVYRTDDSKEGKFLVIVDKNKNIMKKFSTNNNSGFSALLEYSGVLRWYKCMDCSDYETVMWSGKNYYLE